MKGCFSFLKKDMQNIESTGQRKHKHHEHEMRADGIQYEMMYSLQKSLYLQSLLLVSGPYYLVESTDLLC